MNDNDWIYRDIQFLLLFLFEDNEQVKHLNLSQRLVKARIQGKHAVACIKIM